jgi:hypothetical protein
MGGFSDSYDALSKLKAEVDAADVEWDAQSEKAVAAQAAADAAQEKLEAQAAVFAHELSKLKAEADAADAEWEAQCDKAVAAQASADAAQEKLECEVANARQEWRLRNALLS